MKDLVLISGPSGVGKTSVAACLVNRLVGYSILNQDDFCRNRSSLLIENDFFSLNHDHPDVIDHEHAEKVIVGLRTGMRMRVPRYEHSKLKAKDSVEYLPCNLIYEGLHTLYHTSIVASATLSVFIDAPKDVLYERRRIRDIEFRGVEKSRYDDYFNNFVWPGYEKYVKPVIPMADLYVDGRQPVEDICNEIMEALI